MDARKFEKVQASWSDDGLNAVIQSTEGSWIAHLRVEQWYADQQVEAELAWVASWLDPDAEKPTMLSAAIERPALTADDIERRRDLVQLALAVIDHPPETPVPFAAPAPTPEGADEWAQHLGLQHGCWEEAFDELMEACKDMGRAGEFKRYRTLTQALDWAYAMDNSLSLLWRSLPEEVREEASLETDERARKAAERNAAGMLPFNVETDPAFAGYVRRLRDHQPYTHWGEVMLAGIFQAQFFQALSWVRGQLIHAATSAPMDLRQFRPGAEPRWKWRGSGLFARGRSRDPGRRLYDRLLAEHDVVGLLSHLGAVFFKAEMELRRRIPSIEGAAENDANSSGGSVARGSRTPAPEA